MDAAHERRRRIMGALVFGTAIFVTVFLGARRHLVNSATEHVRTQMIMGTIVEIRTRGLDAAGADRAANAAFAEMRRIDTLFSTYITGGLVQRMNAAAGGSAPGNAVSRDEVSGNAAAAGIDAGHRSAGTVLAFTVPSDVQSVLDVCDSVTRLTAGAFDAALQPLIHAWGFDGDTPAVPSDAALGAARAHAGWGKVRLAEDGRIALASGCGLDFGAIAKGHAVDRAIGVLRGCGVEHALVNAGGEIRTIGGPWRVGVRHPRDEHAVVTELDPRGMAVATSGDYEQFFIVDGIRYHHILDPASGRPATASQSVTVLAHDDTWADALATGIFVLGARRGIALAERLPGVEVLIVDSAGVQHRSGRFHTYETRRDQ